MPYGLHKKVIKKKSSGGLNASTGDAVTGRKEVRSQISQPSLRQTTFYAPNTEAYLRNVSGRSLRSTKGASDSFEKKKSRRSG